MKLTSILYFPPPPPINPLFWSFECDITKNGIHGNHSSCWIFCIFVGFGLELLSEEYGGQTFEGIIRNTIRIVLVMLLTSKVSPSPKHHFGL